MERYWSQQSREDLSQRWHISGVKGWNSSSVASLSGHSQSTTWLLYSPHWDPPPLRWFVVSRLSALASGSNMMRIQRAEHTLQLGGLVKGRRDMAAARLVCPRLVIGTLEGVLHHARLCWLFLQDKNNVSCSCYLIKQTIKTPSSTQSHVLSVSYMSSPKQVLSHSLLGRSGHGSSQVKSLIKPSQVAFYSHPR